jgi:hypothetical protein
MHHQTMRAGGISLPPLPGDAGFAGQGLRRVTPSCHKTLISTAIDRALKIGRWERDDAV